jgi:hypothetical protein
MPKSLTSLLCGINLAKNFQKSNFQRFPLESHIKLLLCSIQSLEIIYLKVYIWHFCPVNEGKNASKLRTYRQMACVTV